MSDKTLLQWTNNHEPGHNGKIYPVLHDLQIFQKTFIESQNYVTTRPKKLISINNLGSEISSPIQLRPDIVNMLISAIVPIIWHKFVMTTFFKNYKNKSSLNTTLQTKMNIRFQEKTLSSYWEDLLIHGNDFSDILPSTWLQVSKGSTKKYT